MRLAEYARRVLELAKTVYLWLGALTALDPRRRARIANYAEAIADTLTRASEALSALDDDPSDKLARRKARRELARIAGYVETIVTVLEHRLDGRKLAGVKRRLEQIGSGPPESALEPRPGSHSKHRHRIDRLIVAEGFFRALADGLRA